MMKNKLMNYIASALLALVLLITIGTYVVALRTESPVNASGRTEVVATQSKLTTDELNQKLIALGKSQNVTILKRIDTIQAGKTVTKWQILTGSQAKIDQKHYPIATEQEAKMMGSQTIYAYFGPVNLAEINQFFLTNNFTSNSLLINLMTRLINTVGYASDRGLLVGCIASGIAFCLLLVHLRISQRKKNAIQALMGMSKRQIIVKNIKSDLKEWFYVQIVVVLGMMSYLGIWQKDLLGWVLSCYLMIMLVIFVLACCLEIMVSLWTLTENVGSVIKGGGHTTVFIGFALVLQTLFLLILLLVVKQTTVEFNHVTDLRQSAQQWHKIDDFYRVQFNVSASNLKEANQFTHAFNGEMLRTFKTEDVLLSWYHKTYVPDNTQETGDRLKSAMQLVTPAYLNYQKIKDVNGQLVTIKSDSRVTILIPENQKNQVDAIKDNLVDQLGVTGISKNSPGLKIVYTKSNQKIFGFNTSADGLGEKQEWFVNQAVAVINPSKNMSDLDSEHANDFFVAASSNGLLLFKNQAKLMTFVKRPSIAPYIGNVESVQVYESRIQREANNKLMTLVLTLVGTLIVYVQSLLILVTIYFESVRKNKFIAYLFGKNIFVANRAFLISSLILNSLALAVAGYMGVFSAHSVIIVASLIVIGTVVINIWQLNKQLNNSYTVLKGE